MIAMNDFKRQWLDTGSEVLRAVDAVGSSGWYILGREVKEFEAVLAQTCGRRHAAGVASGLDAIEISLRILECQPGDRVLTTPLTAFATTLAIAKLGAVPVFVDTDSHGLIDLDGCEEVLRNDSSIRFFVPVHLYGHSLDCARLQELRDRYELKMVEDCAQSILASDGTHAAGTVGQLAATSFYPTKNLGCLGDGGAILADEESLAAAARRMRDYGQGAKYRHDVPGYNSRLDEIQAAVLGRVYLPRLKDWTARRRAVASAYIAGIENRYICVLGSPTGSDSCWHLFPVLVEPARKTGFMDHLRANGVACAEHYPTPVPEQPAMRRIPHKLIGDLVRTRQFCRSEVSLPIHPFLTDEEVGAVITVCNMWRR